MRKEVCVGQCLSPLPGKVKRSHGENNNAPERREVCVQEAKAGWGKFSSHMAT